MSKHHIYLIIFIIYFIVLILISKIATRTSSKQSFFTGDRKSPWYMVAFGMVGATLSGVTFISVPGEVGAHGFSYFQFVIGNMIGYIVIAYLILPYFYKKGVVSIYETLNERLGIEGSKTASILFIISKLIGAAFRLYLAALVLQMAIFNHLNVPFEITSLICIVCIILYTMKGGIRSVVFTDVFQTFVLLSAAVAVTIALVYKNTQINGTESSLLNIANLWDFDWKSPDFIIKQLIGGAFVTIGINGLDQDIMQKNLTCKDMKSARKNMIFFSITFACSVFLFLCLGSMLFTYANNQSIQLPTSSDQVFPTIALGHLGFGVSTLFLLGVCAAAFSSADSALTSMTTSCCVDLLDVRKQEERVMIKKRQWIHLSLAFLLLAIVVIFYHTSNQSVVRSIFKAAGYTYGPIIGLFCFSIFSNRMIRKEMILPLSIITPFICYFIVNRIEHSELNYTFGFEIVILNSILCYLNLVFFSKKASS